MRTSIRLLVGLGNPGREYACSRHNIGFLVTDAYATAHRAVWGHRREFEAEIARFTHSSGGEIHLLKPLSYMNESGRAVAAFCRYFRIEPHEVVLVFDEINLPFGRAKLSLSGSAGGHNGVASVLQHLGDGFRRLRIGIDPRHPRGIELKDYVLGSIPPEHQTLFQQNLPSYIAGLDLLIAQGVSKAMNQINRRPTTDDRSNQENV